MTESARRIRLHSDLKRFPIVTQTLNRECRVGIRRITFQKACITVDRIGCTDKTLRGKRGCNDPYHGGITYLKTFGPGTIDQKLH